MDNQDKNPLEYDILGFDAVARSEQGIEIELLREDNMTGSGVVVTIIGKHAETVTRWSAKLINEAQREAALAQRSGKMPPPKPIEELRLRNVEGAALRVIGWRNVKQSFSQELMRAALVRNPHWIDQIVEESDKAANFMQRQ